MTSVAKLTIEIAANIARLQADMGKVKSTVEGAMGSVRSSINGVKAGIAGLAAGLSLGAMAGFLKPAIDTADAMDELSQRIGVGVKDLAGLQLAFRFGGVEAASMQTAMVRLALEASKNSEVFKVLGLSVKSSDGSLKSSRELLGEIAEKFQGLDDGARKTALVVEVFGKSGADLIPLLNGGAEGLAEFDAMAAKLGLTISSKTAAQAAKFNDVLDVMSLQASGLSMQISSELLPVLTTTAEAFGQLSAGGQAVKIFAEALKTVFQTVVVVGSDVYFVISQILQAIVALAETVYKVSTGQFKQALDVFPEYNEQARQARASLDKFQNSIMSSGASNEVLAAATIKAAGAQTTLNETGTKGVKVNKDLVDQVKALAKAREDHENYLQRQSDAETESTEKIREQVAEVRQQIEVLGLTNSELQDLEQLKLNDAIATLEMKIALAEFGAENRALIPAFQSQIQALKDLKAAKAELSSRQGEQESVEAAMKIAEAQAKEVVKSFESITGDIASAITNGIADGSIKGQDFLKRLLKTTVVRVGIEPFIKSAVGSLFGAFGFGGLANAGEAASAASTAGGLGSLVSGVKSAFDFVSGGFTSIGNAAFEGALKLTEFTSLSLESSLSVANSASIAAQALAGVAGGVAAGRAVSGGFAVGGGTGNSAVNVGTTVGAIVGSVVPVIGTALGAFLGGIAGGTFNRLFGRKTVLGASGIQGDFTGQGLSNAVGFQDVTQKGGLFRSSKSFTNFFGIDTKAIDALNQAFLDVRQSVEMASNALGADFVSGLANLNLTGRLGSDLQAVLSTASDSLVKEIIKSTLVIETDFLDFLEGIKQESEKLVDTFVRVSRGVSTANRVMLLLGQTSQFSIRNAEQALGLVTSLGDQGLQLLDQFVQSFVPVQDQFKRQVELFDQTVRELGLSSKVSIETTREEFAALVQSIDLTTAAGQRELALLLQIMPQLTTLITKREQEKAATEALSNSIETNVQRIRGDFDGLITAIQTRADGLSADSFRLAVDRIQSAVNGITPQPVVDFAAAVSAAVPTDGAYRGFIDMVGQLQPSVGSYLSFVDSISGFTPNTAAYRAFTDAVSGAKPTDTAYREFVASVQGLKPSDALYQAFISAVSAATPSSNGFFAFVAQVQAQADSVKTANLNFALDTLKAQIEQLQSTVTRVDFSNFTAQINSVNADIVRLGTEISNATDVTLRLQLEDQLQQRIVARYELEQQLLGGVFASIQELMGSLKNERIAVREAAIQILGGPRVLSPEEIRAGVRNAATFENLPSSASVAQADARVISANAAIQQSSSSLASQRSSREALDGSLASAEGVFSKEINLAVEAVRLFNSNNRVGSAFATNSQGGLAQASYSQERGAELDYNRITFNVGDEASVIALRDQLNNVNKFASLFGESITGAVFSANQDIQNANSRIQQVRADIDLSDLRIAQTEVMLTNAQSELLEAEKARAMAQQQFAEDLQRFVIDAGKAASQLGRLREETVRYFQEQQRLASVLMVSSQGLRNSVAEIRFNDLNPQQQLANLQGQFSSAFSRASSLNGDALAAAGNDLNALINPILQKAGEVFASGSEFQAIKDAILAQAEQVAGRIEALTPVNFQQESLALLDTIDTSLALIEANTKSAEQLIVDAIGMSANRTIAALAEIYKGITGNEIPAFAKGGMYSGGMALVGEEGPELINFNRGGMVYTARQTQQMLRGGGGATQDNAEVVAELRESNRLMAAQMRVLQATAQQNAADSAEMRDELRQLRRKAFVEAGQ